MSGVEDDVGGVARAKLQAVVTLKSLSLDALAVNKCAVLAALIYEKKTLAFQDNLGVVARYARIGDDKVFVYLTSHTERSAVEDNIFLLIALHQHQGGKHARAGTVRMTDRSESHWSMNRRMLVWPFASRN